MDKLSQKNAKQISFILPVYNVAEWLGDCLNSLLCQGIPADDYEIICVIDGSTDNSAAIAKEYASKNSNIIVIEQENSGVSSARNKGLERASGKYVWFIDPDDKLCTGFFAGLLEKITDEDVIYFGFKRIGENDFGSVEADEGFVLHGGFDITRDDGWDRLRNMRPGVGNNAWCKVIRRSLLIDNGIGFPESLTYGEDTYFSFLVASRSKKAAFADTAPYLYRQRSSSAMNTKNSVRRKRHLDSMIGLLKLYRDQLEHHAETYSEYHKMILTLKINNCSENVLFDILPLNKNEFNRMLSEMKSIGAYPYSYRKEALKLKQYPNIKTKLLALMKYPLPNETYARFAAFIARHVGRRG